jgi:ATPase subunit of ABC transporter with duplicated ATPase domains
LHDISLGFFYGAKIGVLGLNGAGKSTLLRIMAGIDPDYIGEIAMSKGYTVGMLEQSRNWTRRKPSGGDRGGRAAD